MKNSFRDWGKVDSLELDKVIDLVITNGTIETTNPDTHLYHLFGDLDKHLKVLDFGCGICRNAGYLSLNYPTWEIYGYDNNNMLKHASHFCEKKYSINIHTQHNLKLISDWDKLKTEKFDVIFAMLVFQHIHENNINEYLKNISKMTKKLIVFGRRYNDEFHYDSDNKVIFKNTWEIFENNGYYPSNANEISYKKYGDLEEHSLCIYNFD
jgi:cyclopropane fatty-acyl-phospholipid synthase-like methyltransferase